MISSNEFLDNYNQLKDLLFGFAMKLTKNQSDAQDLVQDTTLRAFKNKDKFQQGTNFKAWITTIMRNSFINKYRKNKRKNLVSGPIEDYTYSIESSELTQSDTGIMAEDLNKIVDSLQENYKVPFMASFRGFKYNEIAERLDIPLGTVKSRINYARKILREKISQEYAIA